MKINTPWLKIGEMNQKPLAIVLSFNLQRIQISWGLWKFISSGWNLTSTEYVNRVKSIRSWIGFHNITGFKKVKTIVLFTTRSSLLKTIKQNLISI